MDRYWYSPQREKLRSTKEITRWFSSRGLQVPGTFKRGTTQKRIPTQVTTSVTGPVPAPLAEQPPTSPWRIAQQALSASIILEPIVYRETDPIKVIVVDQATDKKQAFTCRLRVKLGRMGSKSGVPHFSTRTASMVPVWNMAEGATKAIHPHGLPVRLSKYTTLLDLVKDTMQSPLGRLHSIVLIL